MDNKTAALFVLFWVSLATILLFFAVAIFSGMDTGAKSL